MPIPKFLDNPLKFNRLLVPLFDLRGASTLRSVYARTRACLVDALVLIKNHTNSKVDGKENRISSLNLNVLWICLFCAVLLDIIGLFRGLGFYPSFQLETQPFFFAGIAATIFFTILRARIGPLLAGVIFWIPVVVLAADLLLNGDVVPFGGDIVGMAELVTAVVGIVAAHKTYHGFQEVFI